MSTSLFRSVVRTAEPRNRLAVSVFGGTAFAKQGAGTTSIPGAHSVADARASKTAAACGSGGRRICDDISHRDPSRSSAVAGARESQPGIYDRPIGLRLLYQDPGSGAEHYLVRYPAGLRARHHRHSAAHTIVLDGAMQANGQLLHVGSYAHFVAGAVMQHAPAPGEHCLFVILFHGPFDVTAVEM